jgi:hypothetical protein
MPFSFSEYLPIKSSLEIDLGGAKPITLLLLFTITERHNP